MPGRNVPLDCSVVCSRNRVLSVFGVDATALSTSNTSCGPGCGTGIPAAHMYHSYVVRKPSSVAGKVDCVFDIVSKFFGA